MSAPPLPVPMAFEPVVLESVTPESAAFDEPVASSKADVVAPPPSAFPVVALSSAVELLDAPVDVPVKLDPVLAPSADSFPFACPPWPLDTAKSSPQPMKTQAHKATIEPKQALFITRKTYHADDSSITDVELRLMHLRILAVCGIAFARRVCSELHDPVGGSGRLIGSSHADQLRCMPRCGALQKARLHHVSYRMSDDPAGSRFGQVASTHALEVTVEIRVDLLGEPPPGAIESLDEVIAGGLPR